MVLVTYQDILGLIVFTNTKLAADISLTIANKSGIHL
jgi:hypothetical protein